MHAVMGTGRLIAGRYRLQGPLGRGAMGIVWRGRDELLHRDVAVKEVQIPALAPASEAETIYQRTLREARTAGRLTHPGVVTIFDVVEEDGSPWIVMELIGGRSLDQVIAEDGPLPPRSAAAIGTSLVGALAAAHAAGVLHRDVKPGNVLVTAEGRAVLTDFGIATFAGDPGLTQAGMVVGTPGFTAPERVRGESATPASDLWSLGATLYAAVEGRGPFDRVGGATAITAGVVSEEAPRAPSAGPLGPAIDALLRRDPATRPDAAAARTLLTDAGAAAGSPGPAGPGAGSGRIAAFGAGAAAGAPAGLPDPAGHRAGSGSLAAFGLGAAAGAAVDGLAGRAASAADQLGTAEPAAARPGAGGPGAGGPGAAGTGAARPGADGPSTARPGAGQSSPAEMEQPRSGLGRSGAANGVAGSGAAGSRLTRSGDVGSADAATAALPAAGYAGPASFLDPPVYADLRIPGPGDRDPGPGDAWLASPPGRPGGLPASLGPAGPEDGAAGAAARPGQRRAPQRQRQPWSRHWRMATVATGIAAIVVAAVLGSEIYSRSVSGSPVSSQAGQAAAGASGSAAAGAASPAAGTGTAPGTAGSAGASTGPDGAASGPAGAGSPAAGSTVGGSTGVGSTVAGTAPPPGYQWRTVTAARVAATAGFVLAIPDGWQQRISGQTAVFAAPGGGASIAVSMSPFTYQQPGREAHYRQAQATAAQQYPGYRRGGIRAARFQGAPAATWRYSWKPGGGARTSVLSLLVTLPTSAGSQSYALTVSSPAATFAAASSAFGQALATFASLPPA